MNSRLALIVLTACGAPEAPEVPSGVDPARLATETSRYPAFSVEQPAQRAPGLHGVVKLTVEHHLQAADGSEASFVAQGAGALIVSGGDWLVVTARHLVVPDASVRSVTHAATGEEVTLADVARTRAAVRLGSLGVAPSGMLVHEREDAAILSIAPDRRAALAESLFEDAARPILPAPKGVAAAGRDVEAWGFPTGHLPQVEKLSISALQPAYIALNRALSRGFSGGPVLAVDPSGKRAVGVVIRSDSALDQSTVLYWSVVERMLANPAERIGVSTGETATVSGTPFTLGEAWAASGAGEVGAAQD